MKNRIRLCILSLLLCLAVLLCSCTADLPSTESSEDSMSSEESSEETAEPESSEEDSTVAESSEEETSEEISEQISEENSEDSAVEDITAPVFTDAKSGVLPALSQTIGQSVNVLKGLNVTDDFTASDAILLAIADNGGYDSDKAGSYIFTITATDEAGNQASATRTVTVSEDSDASDEYQGTTISIGGDIPYVLNSSDALKYTTSGTKFRSSDTIQIMDTETFVSQYQSMASGHTNNGNVPFFPNGVLVFANKNFEVVKVCIAGGTNCIEIDADGTITTDGLQWNNSIDAANGGGMFKNILNRISSVLPDGGYLGFVGNPEPQSCRTFLIRSLFNSNYTGGAFTAEDCNVSLEKTRILPIDYTEKDTEQDTPDQPSTSSSTLTSEEVMNGLEIYTGKISGEVSAKNPEVFKGAYYHKVVSSKDSWIGIESTVTLPEYDINRYSGSYDDSLPIDPNAKNLDNPSVYLGGSANYESDIGLSLSKGLIMVNGSQQISTGAIVFRPFWRYITTENQDVGGYDVHDGLYAVSATGSNCIANYHYKYTEYYYLPGDTVRIMVYSPKENYLQFQIEVISVSTLEYSVNLRKANGWKDPQNFTSPLFYSPGYGAGVATEYKRVNAIDQSGNEGKNAIVTTSSTTGTVWHSTYLYRVIDGKAVRVPMDSKRSGVRNAPEDCYITVTTDGLDTSVGGERVDIHPSQKS